MLIIMLGAVITFEAIWGYLLTGGVVAGISLGAQRIAINVTRTREDKKKQIEEAKRSSIKTRMEEADFQETQIERLEKTIEDLTTDLEIYRSRLEKASAELLEVKIQLNKEIGKNKLYRTQVKRHIDFIFLIKEFFKEECAENYEKFKSKYYLKLEEFKASVEKFNHDELNENN